MPGCNNASWSQSRPFSGSSRMVAALYKAAQVELEVSIRAASAVTSTSVTAPTVMAAKFTRRRRRR